MKLLKRFRKQSTSEDIEAQAARELDAVMAAGKPGDMDVAMPGSAPASPHGDDEQGGVPVAPDTGHADAAAPVTDLSAARRAPAGKPRSSATSATRATPARTRTQKRATPAAGAAKAPVRKTTARKAVAGTEAPPAPAKKPRSTATATSAKKAPARTRASQSQPAPGKR